jgi:hypothetical protein
MFPVPFFIVLILLLCYLLYKTRITEEEILLTGKNKFNQVEYGVNENLQDK